MNNLKNLSISNKLKQIFKSNSEIIAVYVFGSRASNSNIKSSDLDLAVVTVDKNKFSHRDLLKIFQKELNLSMDFDVSIVDCSSPPILMYQIIKNGQCLYQKKLQDRINLEAKILHLYYDNQYMRNIYHMYLKKSIRQGNYGYR